MTPGDQLRKAFEGAPRLAGSGAMDELTEAGAGTLLSGGSVSQLADALLDLWTDVEHRDDVQPRMLACGLVRSVEVWETLTLDGRLETNVADALDRMFGTLVKRPNVIGASQRETFVEALLERVEALTQASAPLEAEALGWVTPACSVVALAPAAIERAMSPLFAVEAERWRATLRFYAALGYPAADHPWRTEPKALWDRFGAEASSWTEAAATSLGEQLADDVVRQRVDAVSGHAADAERADVAQICEELAELQIPAVWGPRRACLLSRLMERDPSPYWDDETGIG